MINPYIAGAPVTETRMFFGREDIFEWIQNSLTGSYADHILVVHGQRRVGKTSVLKQLRNRLPEKYIPVFFDLQGRTHTTLDRFLWWLARETVRVLKQDRNAEVPVPKKDDFAQDLEYFENTFLPGLRPILNGHSLLYTFDEFDNLEEGEVKKDLAGPLIDHLRRLMEREEMSFIFSIGSSGRKLENMQATYTEFFKSALYKKISFLSEEQTKDLVTRPVEGLLEYDHEAVEHIYELTSGHPYFTQLTCHEIFARCQRTNQQYVKNDDVKAILDDVVERGTVNLKFTWDEASDLEKWSLAGLAQLNKTDNPTLSEYLSKQRVRFSASDLTSCLLHLREKDVLTPENCFVIYLLKLWLQKNRPIEQVREELTEVNPIANRYLEIGLEFKYSGQYNKAIESFQDALEIAPDNIQAQVNIAQTYMDQGAYDKAVFEFEKALKIDDEDVAARSGLCEAHLALGNAALQEGRMQEAMQSFECVLEINFEHTEARQRMADIHHQRAEEALTFGRDEEALSAFADALKYTPEDSALVERAKVVEAEKKDKVIASLIARSEKEVSAKNWGAAVNALGEVHRLSPDNPHIQERLNEVRGKLREENLIDLRARAQGYTKDEKYNEALITWQEYLALEPEDREQIEKEIAELQNLQKLDGIYRRAQMAISVNEYDQAISLLKDVILQDENFRDTSRLLNQAIEARRARHLVWFPASFSTILKWLFISVVLISLGTGTYFAWNQWGNPIGGAPPMPIITNTVTPTKTKTATPTLTTTPTATYTPSPSPTFTNTPIPAWVPDFVEPMLERITNLTPDFMEDFSNPQRGWEVIAGPDASFQIVDGVARVSVKKEERTHFYNPTVQSLAARDFIMEMDARIVEGEAAIDLWTHFIFNEDPSVSRNVGFYAQPAESTWSVTIDSAQGRNSLGGKGIISPVGQYTHITIILTDQKVAFSLNGNPIVYFEAPFLDEPGGFHFNCDGRSTGGVCEYDNIKIWKLR